MNPPHLKAATRRKLTTIANATLVSMLCGFVYPFIFTTSQQPGSPAWHSHLNGIAIGFFLGLSLSFGEMYIFQTYLRRLRFSLFILAQTFYYAIATNMIIIVVMGSHLVIFHGLSFTQAFQAVGSNQGMGSTEFLTINLYALAVILFISVFRRINRMLGPHALFNFLIGKYHKPVEEERVFMFLDLKSSTTIAEKLGHALYHRFLNDFFYDITPAIIDSKGEIYQYVGDEVVVTWTGEKGLRDANCINCYFRVFTAIAAVSDKYERKYGFTPTFKAGFHYGTVIAGLIGDIKRDMVFHGDTVNTAARIRSECTVLGRDLLLSQDLLKRISISEYLSPESMGSIRLRGKEQEIELFSVKEAA